MHRSKIEARKVIISVVLAGITIVRCNAVRPASFVHLVSPSLRSEMLCFSVDEALAPLAKPENMAGSCRAHKPLIGRWPLERAKTKP